MSLFGEEPLSRKDFIHSFNQPRLLWPKQGEPRWRTWVKRALSKIYLACAKIAYRTSQAMRPVLRWRKPALVVLAAILIVVGLAFASVVAYRMWRVPAWVLDGATTSEQVASRIATYRSAQGGVLSVLIQATGGLGLFAALFFTWRQIIAGQEAQVSERFTRSVEQLSNDRVEVRVGGIHGLERIAFSREAEFQSILLLLTAFVLERAQEHKGSETNRKLPLDLQIALATLVRFQKRLDASDRYWMRVSLRGINLSYARLSDVDFGRFDLREADFHDAILDAASFHQADLGEANFESADLRFAILVSATFVYTKAMGANLTDALLRRATGNIDLRNANLTGADLEWSMLQGDFRGAILRHILCYQASLSFSNFEGVDLRETRGIWDGQVTGAPGSKAGVILPGKSMAEAYKEGSGRSEFWRPPPGTRVSIRGGSTRTSYGA